MPTMLLPPTSGPTSVTSAYAVLPMNATSTTPPKGNPTIRFGKPLANVVISPVSGSTREILPAWASVTYSAPPGPRALPEPPCNPVTSSSAVGPSDGILRASALPLPRMIAQLKARPITKLFVFITFLLYRMLVAWFTLCMFDILPVEQLNSDPQRTSPPFLLTKHRRTPAGPPGNRNAWSGRCQNPAAMSQLKAPSQ